MDTGGADITGYELQVRTGDGGADFVVGDTIIEDLPANRFEYTHTGARSGVMYFYRVRAVNVAGEGAWSPPSMAVQTTTAAVGTPGVPRDFSAMPGSGGTKIDQIALDWDRRHRSSGDSPISRYEIQFRQGRQDDDANDDADDGEAAWDGAAILVPSPPTATEYDHDGLLGGKRYVYRVRAVNGSGGGAWSGDADATTAARAADAPELTATANGTDEILLEWTKPAANGSTSASPATSSRDGIPATKTLERGLTPICSSTSDADTTLYMNTGLTPGTMYYYRIRTDAGRP